MKTNVAMVVVENGAKPGTKKVSPLRDLAARVAALTPEERAEFFDAATEHFCLVCGEESTEDGCSNGCTDDEVDP